MFKIPEDIFKSLYHYFPIGMPNLVAYSGIREMEQLVENKIGLQCNDPKSTCNRLFDALNKGSFEVTWENENYHHYPSYTINCLIIEENQKGISHQLRLRITISMLCDYFTIFCDDQYGFTDFKKQFTFAAVYDIFSFEVSKYKLPDGLLTLIESEIDRYYPGKKFIPHDIIMNARISGSLPYNEDPRVSTGDMAFSIYDLLFYYHITGDHRVLE